MAVEVLPLDEAVRKISDKTPIGSILRTDEWASMPMALRERAFFSATIESARLLTVAQDKIRKAVSLQREKVKNGEALVDRSSFIADLRKIAIEEGIYVDPAKRGGLQDITSRKRLALIFDINQQQAQEYARWKAEQDPDILDAFPAQELIRLEDRTVPRLWRNRWVAAGGRIFNGRMIAPKSSTIWSNISRFGVPWPPFDFNSGMGLEDIDRAEAEELGVIKPGEIVPPLEIAFNKQLQASVRGFDPRTKQHLKDIFGDQIDITGDVVKWKGHAPLPAPRVTPKPAPVPKPVPADTLQPGGKPVSEAVDIQIRVKAEKAKIQSAIATIDSVHGDGRLLPIPINQAVPKNTYGVYRAFPTTAKGISVLRNYTGAELTFAHEVGHWIDHIGIPSRTQFASQSGEPLFEGFWKAVKASKAYQALGTIPNTTTRDYLLRGREVWARAYAQFIATRSGNPAMLSRLEELRTSKLPQRQWSDEDFVEIGNAIEGMFKELGWMK